MIKNRMNKMLIILTLISLGLPLSAKEPGLVFLSGSAAQIGNIWEMEKEIIVAVALGIGLSASAGFRVFLPLLVAGLAARLGFLPLNESFAWLQSTPALAALGVATFVEIIAYYVPFVDNLLDSIAMPLAIGAGTLLAASVLPVDNGFLKWLIAIVIGGGASATVQGATTTLRLASSGATGGLGNPVISTGENAAAIGISLLAIALPVLMVLVLLLLLIFIFRRTAKRKRRLKNNNKI